MSGKPGKILGTHLQWTCILSTSGSTGSVVHMTGTQGCRYLPMGFPNVLEMQD